MGRTPLHHVAGYSTADAVTVLLEVGAGPGSARPIRPKPRCIVRLPVLSAP